MIKKLSAERGKLIHAHESSAKPRKVHISYSFGATGTSEFKPKTIKNPKESLKIPKIFRLRRQETSETAVKRTFHSRRWTAGPPSSNQHDVGGYASSGTSG